METTTIIAVFLIWHLIGAYSFYYWWTKDYDLGADELPLLILSSFAGFFSWIIGWSIHGKTKIKNITLFKKR